mgnify:FL=1
MMAERRKATVRQWQLFQLALMFFTCIPVSENVDYSAERLSQSSRYFSLVGIVVALVFIACFELANLLWPVEIAVLLSMIVGFLITGGFHEDGLADTADGIGGAMTKVKRLSIMKDSRIGTYGVLALLSVLLLKFQLLLVLATASEQLVLFVAGVILANSLSRALAGSLIHDTPYVSSDDTSKSKPLAAQQSSTELQILLIVGSLPLIAFVSADYFWQLLIW